MFKLIPDPQLASWRPWDHLGALRLLFFLYRKPMAFKQQADGLKRVSQARLAFSLYLHALPWSLVLIILCRAILFNLGALKDTSILLSLEEMATVLVGGIIPGIAVAIAFGIALSLGGDLAGGITRGFAIGLAVSIVIGLAYGCFAFIAKDAHGIPKDAIGIALGLASGSAFGIVRGFSGGTAIGITEGIAYGIALVIISGISGTSAIGNGIAFAIAIPRAYYLLVHYLVYRIPTRWRVRWYRYHPIAWDDWCGARFTGLSGLLVEVWQADPDFGREEINPIAAYPFQQPEGLIALATLQNQTSAPD